MKIYTNKTFTGHYPVGSAAVVCATSRIQAVALLNIQLREIGLSGDAEVEDMIELKFDVPAVRILEDGNY